MYDRSPRDKRTVWGYVILIAGFLVFFIGTPVAAVTGTVHPVIPPLLGFALISVGAVTLVVDDTIPPDPPRYARYAPGRPVRVACPNCGASLRWRDYKGMARCDYCQTRFLVP